MQFKKHEFIIAILDQFYFFKHDKTESSEKL